MEFYYSYNNIIELNGSFHAPLQAVVANILGKHRTTVTVVSLEGNGSKVTNLELSPDELDRGTEIEELIVSELVREHNVM